MKRDVPLVVIASDDAEMRKQLYAPLRRQEYFVTTCAAGAEALEVVRRGKPDVVISDAGPSHEGGLDFVVAIKAASRDSRVVMLSATADWPLHTGALDRGADDLLPRPPTDWELRRAVQRILIEKVAQ